MRKSLLAALILTPAVASAQVRHRTPASTLTDVAPGTDLIARVSTPVRLGPGANFEAAATVSPGHLVTVRSCDSGWCAIGGIGDYHYVAAKDLEPLDDWMAAQKRARRHRVHRKPQKTTAPVAPKGQPAAVQPIVQPVPQPVPQATPAPVKRPNASRPASTKPASMVTPAPVAPNLVRPGSKS